MASEQLTKLIQEGTEQVLSKLEDADFHGAVEVIDRLKSSRDKNLYQEVGTLTRALHNAIVNFEIDVKSNPGDGSSSVMLSAQDRLDYVVNMTKKSADKTMDAVEASVPVVTDMRDGAHVLSEDWQRFRNREMGKEEFAKLTERTCNYLQQVDTGSGMMQEQLNTILLAQDFQDLTGQVIQKVTALMHEVENTLVDLVRSAGQVEEVAGALIKGVPEAEPIVAQASELEGPQIKPQERDDVVSNQDEVDDLLSSLGF